MTPTSQLPGAPTKPLNVTRMRLQYMGVCSLLGRLSRHVKDRDDRALIKAALEDCAAMFPDGLRVVQTTNGFALEPINGTS